MFDVGRQQVAGLRARSDLGVVTAPISYVFNLYPNLNGTDPAYNELTSVNVRRALALSLDSQGFINDNWESGVASVIPTPFPPSILATSASIISGFPFNLAQAKTLLDTEGWTCGGGVAGAGTACAANEVRMKAGERLDLFLQNSVASASEDTALLLDLKA